jgi:transcriptional regulator with XRE-family HTH domain
MRKKQSDRRPLPEAEIAIGERLRNWRLERTIGGAAMAREARLDRQKLYDYETGRTPLSWQSFLAIWDVFPISPEWLATGDGPDELDGLLWRSLVPRIRDYATFSQIYREKLAPLFAEMDEKMIPAQIADLKRFLSEAEAGKVNSRKLARAVYALHRVHYYPPQPIRIGKPSPAEAAHFATLKK